MHVGMARSIEFMLDNLFICETYFRWMKVPCRRGIHRAAPIEQICGKTFDKKNKVNTSHSNMIFTDSQQLESLCIYVCLLGWVKS